MYKSFIFDFIIVRKYSILYFKMLKLTKKYKIIIFLFGRKINILYFYKVFKTIQNVKT